MGSEEKDFGAIVELLKKDYLSKTENNLKQKTGEIIQDFISQGLYNSEACTGNQLQVHFDHIDKLINHILESLKQDFPDIPLEQVKEKLFTIVDGEYKKLIPLANSHLVSAGLAQQNTLENFERLINGKKEKTKQAIETRLAILEKKKATPPPGSIFGDIWTICGIPINVKKLRTKLKSYPILLICCFLGITLIVTQPLWWPFVNKVENAIKKPPFQPQRHRSQIEKAVYERRNITSFDLCWTGIRNDNDFFEFCLRDFSETWLIQEIPDPILTGEIRRQIKIVNRHLIASESRHKDVLIILLVYRSLSYDEKASLYNQLQLFKSTGSLSPKIRFNVWDQSDVEKALED
jgi:hypothetical protein